MRWFKCSFKGAVHIKKIVLKLVTCSRHFGGLIFFWWWVVFSEAAHCVHSLWIASLIAKSYRVSIHLIDFLIRNASATGRTMELYYPSLLGWLMWMWDNSENGEMSRARSIENTAALRKSNRWSFLERTETVEAERIYKPKIGVNKHFFFFLVCRDDGKKLTSLLCVPFPTPWFEQK